MTLALASTVDLLRTVVMNGPRSEGHGQAGVCLELCYTDHPPHFSKLRSKRYVCSKSWSMMSYL